MISIYLRLFAITATFIPFTGCGTEDDALKPEVISPPLEEELPTLETELAEILGPRLSLPGQINDRTRRFKGVSIVGGNLDDAHINAILQITAQDKEAEVTLNEIQHVDRIHVAASIVRHSSSTKYLLCFADGRWAMESTTHGSGY